MSKLLATSITSALKPLVRKDGTFDLSDTRKHNVIEHDNSFTRHDEWQGDNYTFQPDMFDAMLVDANGGPLTLATLAKSFVRRDKESEAAGAPKLPLKLWFVRLLNIGSAISAPGLPGRQLPRDVAEQLFVEERWADVILKNTEQRKLRKVVWNACVLVWHVVIKR